MLLTGGSQGMGRALAVKLARRGAHVVVVARDVHKLDTTVADMAQAAKHGASQRFHRIAADLTRAGECARVLAEATAWNGGAAPDVVWANAGGSRPSLFVDTDRNALRRQMDLNYWTAADLAHETLRAWWAPAPAKRSRDAAGAAPPRHLILTSSSVAFVNIAGYAPYGPAKTALRGLADALRSEANVYNGARRSRDAAIAGRAPAFDTRVHLVAPGTIDSPGLVAENETKPGITHLLEASDPVQTPDAAADGALAGLDRGHAIIATNWLGKLMRISALGGSPRNSIVLDTLGMWLTSLLWLFIGPDMEGKAWKWGKDKGVVEKRSEQ